MAYPSPPFNSSSHEHSHQNGPAASQASEGSNTNTGCNYTSNKCDDDTSNHDQNADKDKKKEEKKKKDDKACSQACQLRRQAAWVKLIADTAMFAALVTGGDEEEAAEGLEAEAAQLEAEAEAAEQGEAEQETATRNTADDKPLSPRDIKKLKDAGYDPHDLKPNSKYDLFKDRKGDVYVKPKSGAGPGDPTGININDL